MTMQGTTQNPYQHDPFQTDSRPSRGNSLGLFGLLFSLLGLLLSCGTCAMPILAVVPALGLVLSFMGLFKRPRGTAITGFIIGILAVVLTAFGIFFWGVGKAFGGTWEFVKAGAVVSAVRDYQNLNNGALPPDLNAISAQLPPPFMKDKWGNAFIYEPAQDNSTFTLKSAGPDGQPDTADDVDFDKLVQEIRRR